MGLTPSLRPTTGSSRQIIECRVSIVDECFNAFISADILTVVEHFFVLAVLFAVLRKKAVCECIPYSVHAMNSTCNILGQRLDSMDECHLFNQENLIEYVMGKGAELFGAPEFLKMDTFFGTLK
jgi:hypothetical protein